VVPKVIGAKLATAKARIKARHCRVGKLTYIKSTKRKKGKVIRELPRAGKRLGNNARVNLWLGKGPAKRN
jgi:beta-lactam-binding protein with PASTA domain